MKAPAPGSKEEQVRALRLRRAEAKPLPREERAKKTMALKKRIAAGGDLVTPPARASASTMETTMKTKSKLAKSAAKKAAARRRDRAAKAKPKSANARTKVADVRPGSKLEKVVKLLQRPGGTTTAEVLKATGWPTVSMPQQASAAGITLKTEKEGNATRYWDAAFYSAGRVAPAKPKRSKAKPAAGAPVAPESSPAAPAVPAAPEA